MPGSSFYPVPNTARRKQSLYLLPSSSLDCADKKPRSLPNTPHPKVPRTSTPVFSFQAAYRSEPIRCCMACSASWSVTCRYRCAAFLFGAAQVMTSNLLPFRSRKNSTSGEYRRPEWYSPRLSLLPCFW